MTVTVSREVTVRPRATVTPVTNPPVIVDNVTVIDGTVVTYTRHPITTATNVLALLTLTSAVGAAVAAITGNDALRSWLIVSFGVLLTMTLLGLSDDHVRRSKTL